MIAGNATRPARQLCRRIAVVSLAAATMAACSIFGETPTPTPPPPPAPPPRDQSSAAAGLERAVRLLKNGEAKQADADLHEQLQNFPDSKPMRYLIAEIESPLSDLYPADSFPIKAAKDENFSSLARTWLGNSLGFYGLARYNGIAVTAKLGEGQTIRIPKTPAAMRALAKQNTIAAVEPADQTPPLRSSAASDGPSPQQRHLADEYYKRGLSAFQRQDLDGAIADWNRVLALDPDYRNARLNRDQAVRLKNNLTKLRGATASPH